MEEEYLKVSPARVAQALAADYFCIYYVNTKNNKFIEYSASEEYRALGLPRSGEDFISFSRERFESIIYPEDQERFLDGFVKEKIISELDAHGIYKLAFRLMFNGVPTYVQLKVTRMIEKEGTHIVIGISSVDEQMKAMEAFEMAHHASITFGRVATALAGDYFSIYVVDLDTDRFVEYSATKEFDTLGVEKNGEDFFNLSRRNMLRLIYEDDRERFMGTFYREKVMSILERDKIFTMKYRLVFGDTPVWVSMKATLLEDNDGRHLIIGTNNIEAQMEREAEYQRRVREARTSARNDFLANMSHDIRTPMNAIVGYTNIAKSNKHKPETVADALDKIGSSSHYLLSLINDILDISKIESGKMQISCGPCDLAELFRRIEDITALQAKKKSLVINYCYDNICHYQVITDELRIEQIIINIVSNAIKYTPPGKTVDLIAEEVPSPGGKNKYRFIIRDTGIGIKEDYMPHIFESFTREERTTVNRIQGTGLGLAITAKIVEMMGGTISVKSKLGEGSEFTVELELEPLETDSQANADNSENIDLAGHRILLVEDNAINAEIARMILEQYGAEVQQAENGKIGLEALQEKGPGYYDAVLMDIQMPVMNGFEATKAIRALGGAYATALPIIAMSANAYDEDVRDCLAAGMNGHIAKPFNPDELMRILRRYISAD
ncbi:Signal transduction histidine kinase [Succiniclasticum ruminis]|uniref:Circadian input-output histidine kinase CikA n=1 Tax=Succiniclasticum ruminis TaxID=40841 RepID=A0A1G6MYF1_9FIRM|nr:ATP-binding protein [Succiniclasticum ruminis]SDC60600.1 Signal transduction histidine kinase [Succiniclasticum ruminis]